MMDGGPDLAAVVQGTDGGCGVVVSQLLLVGRTEAQGPGEGAGAGIEPGSSVLAAQGEVLAGAGAQQPQEGELGHGHGVPIRIHVGELQGRVGWEPRGCHARGCLVPCLAPTFLPRLKALNHVPGFSLLQAAKRTWEEARDSVGLGRGSFSKPFSPLEYSSCPLTASSFFSGNRQVSPPAVKLQNTRKASREQPWLGSIQYCPGKHSHGDMVQAIPEHRGASLHPLGAHRRGGAGGRAAARCRPAPGSRRCPRACGAAPPRCGGTGAMPTPPPAPRDPGGAPPVPLGPPRSPGGASGARWRAAAPAARPGGPGMQEEDVGQRWDEWGDQEVPEHPFTHWWSRGAGGAGVTSGTKSTL